PRRASTVLSGLRDEPGTTTQQSNNQAPSSIQRSGIFCPTGGAPSVTFSRRLLPAPVSYAGHFEGPPGTTAARDPCVEADGWPHPWVAATLLHPRACTTAP